MNEKFKILLKEFENHPHFKYTEDEFKEISAWAKRYKKEVTETDYKYYALVAVITVVVVTYLYSVYVHTPINTKLLDDMKDPKNRSEAMEIIEIDDI